jgi:hypothetical protein
MRLFLLLCGLGLNRLGGLRGRTDISHLFLLPFFHPFLAPKPPLVHDPHLNGTSGYMKARQMTYLGQIIYFPINHNPTIPLIIMFINLTIRDQPLPSRLEGRW